jgi:hypothetical protein
MRTIDRVKKKFIVEGFGLATKNWTNS